MFTTEHGAVDTEGQKQEAHSSSSDHELESRNLTRMSSYSYPLSIEESLERQFDIIEEQGMQLVTRLTTQDINTDVNDHQQKDILDSDSSDSTNLSSIRCILNEEDPDLNNPNLYNCKTCRKGLIHITSSRLSPEADHCDELPFKNNQSRSDLDKNIQNRERYQLRPQKAEQFRTKASFESPTLVHEAQAKFTCKFCRMGFRTPYLLRRHLIVHGNDIDSRYPFKCNKCKKRFVTGSGIEGHNVRVHGAQAKFICKLCQKRFMYKSLFEIHSRTHKTDIEARCPFKCNQCSKRFTTKESLTRHTIVHGAQAKFICDFCSKGFMEKSDLRAHLKVHNNNGKVKFKCEKCPKQYSLKRDLEQHSLVHGAQAKFICDFCSKGFMIKGLLKNHLIVHRKNVDANKD